MAITQTYNLDLVPNGPDVMVKVSQYDAESRNINFIIFNQNQLYSIPSGTTATVRGTKADDTGFEYPCTINGSVVSFLVKQQMTVFNGKVLCEIRLTNSGETLGTANFILFVEKAALSDGTVISETELPLIEEAIEAAATVADTVERVSSILPSNTGTDGQVLTKDGTGAIWADGGGILPTFGRGLYLDNGTLTNTFQYLENESLDNIQYNFQGFVINANYTPLGNNVSCTVCCYAPSPYIPMDERFIQVVYIGQRVWQRAYDQNAYDGWSDWKEITAATGISYSNATSGLSATNVQDAIDELSTFDNDFSTTTIADNVSVPSGTGTGTTVGTVTIPKGTYLYTFTVVFDSNATGFRAVAVGAGTSIPLKSRYANKVQAISGTNTYITLPIIYNLNSATTYNVNCMQNSGGALGVSVYAAKVKLK